MEKSQPSQEAIIELGKKLVKELKLESGVDTLGKWMAHYIAELITRAEATEGAEKEAIEKECFETILKLWDQRDQVPQINSPLKGLELAVKVLKELSEDNLELPYFPAERSLENPSWERLIKVIKKRSKKIVKLSIYASLPHENLQQKQEWFGKHEEFLSNEETLLLKHLNFLINETGSLIESESELDIQLLSVEDRYKAVFDRIDKELALIQSSLVDLKKQFSEGR